MFFQIVLLYLVASAWADEPKPLQTHRIVGGWNANENDFPHQISLQTRSFRHFCGGTLIDPQWVLTAAHCLAKRGVIVVKAGKYNLEIVESSEQTGIVGRAFVHEQYAGGVGPYDIALIQLATPFKLTDRVKTIALPAANVEPVGDAVLSGWGSISRGKNIILPNILQTAVLHLIDANACREDFAKFNPHMAETVHDTNVCTIGGANKESACQGDSGGPLILNNSIGVSEVVGIVSWGTLPCGTGIPSVYTKVSDYVDWIRGKMAYTK